MSRLQIQTAFLGAYTLAALDAAPDAEAAWLIHALCAWILRDELPAKIPAKFASAWAIIRAESEAIHAAKKRDVDNGKNGGRPPKKPKETQTEPKETQSPETETQTNPTETKIEIESKSKRENISEEKKNPSHAGAREVWLDDLTECPVPPDKLEVLAAHLELSPADLGAWKDYYTAQGWRRWPTSPRPMTPAAAEASLRFWKTKKGIEAERQAHIDAKMDERAAKRDAARDPSRFAPPPEKGGIDTAALGI